MEGSSAPPLFLLLVQALELPERDQEQDTEDAAQERTHEYFEEIDRDLWILVLQDVKGGQRKYGACHDHAAVCPDGLDNDIFAQRVFTFEPAG